MDLLQLQNLCKRDPDAYQDEFLQQLRHFENQLQIFQLNPKSNLKEFQDQVNFLSHVRNFKNFSSFTIYETIHFKGCWTIYTAYGQLWYSS
jgi:hypothetical protein